MSSCNELGPYAHMLILSTASSTSDLSFIAGNQSKDVSGMPDPLDVKSVIEVSFAARAEQQLHGSSGIIYSVLNLPHSQAQYGNRSRSMMIPHPSIAVPAVWNYPRTFWPI